MHLAQLSVLIDTLIYPIIQDIMHLNYIRSKFQIPFSSVRQTLHRISSLLT